jgi:hypothetical protein
MICAPDPRRRSLSIPVLAHPPDELRASSPQWVHCPAVIFDCPSVICDSRPSGSNRSGPSSARYAPSIAARFSAGRGDMLVGHERAVAR